MNNKIEHLKMIQNIINRMSNNSFLLKGWTITLLVGILALLGDNVNKYFFIILIPVLAFWALDSYYLMQEKLYRDLYNKGCCIRNEDINFSLEVPPSKFLKKLFFYCKCVISKTEFWFYAPLCVICIVLICKIREGNI